MYGTVNAKNEKYPNALFSTSHLCKCSRDTFVQNTDNMFFITSGLTDIYPVDTEKNEIIREKEIFRKQLFFSLK